MDDYKVVKYTSNYFTRWNDFVAKAKNATFLFHRNFMDYHADKFEDYSLLILKKEKLVGVLPANKVGDIVYSHQGLSYGGIILSSSLKFQNILEIYKTLLQFLYSNKLKTLELKIIPPIYNTLPSDEVNYFMFLLEAELFRRDVHSVISIGNLIDFSNNRFAGIKRAKKHKLKVIEVDDFNDFWNLILLPNLKLKHGVNPVHSLEEMTLLKERFPSNIRQFNVYHDENIVAGVTIFETKYVAHCQYISGNDNKNILGSLDFLHAHLIETVFQKKKYFDFGMSNENDGKKINKGLQYWKEGFGARAITQDFYRINIENYSLLDNILI